MRKVQGNIERTLNRMAKSLSYALTSEKIAAQRGLVQLIDPRIALACTVLLVITAILLKSVAALLPLLAIATAVALTSRVPVKTLLSRVWLIPLLFTMTIAIPAIFTTPGRTIFSEGSLHITEQGVRTVELLVLRVLTAVTFTATLAMATHWNALLKTLRFFRLPREVVMMISMTHRYLFLLVETAVQMFESRRSRLVGDLDRRQQRQLATRTAGVLLNKSVALSTDVFAAMQSRGFTGDIRTLGQNRLGATDVLAGVCALAIATTAILLGR